MLLNRAPTFQLQGQLWSMKGKPWTWARSFCPLWFLWIIHHNPVVGSSYLPYPLNCTSGDWVHFGQQRIVELMEMDSLHVVKRRATESQQCWAWRQVEFKVTLPHTEWRSPNSAVTVGNTRAPSLSHGCLTKPTCSPSSTPWYLCHKLCSFHNSGEENVFTTGKVSHLKDWRLSYYSPKAK